MQLPFNLPFGLGQKNKLEYFLTLILRDENISAVIFQEKEKQIKVVGHHQEFFPSSLDETSFEDLVEIVDKTIGTAENSLPENAESHQTILGVKAEWVENSQIKKEYLGMLKKICDSLDLTPVGFLVIPEAIAHLLTKKEGAPISGILTEIGKEAIAISVVRAGRVVETKKAKTVDSVSETTDKLLHKFTSHEILPSRIIIFDGKDAQDLQQEFINHSWSKSLPFLHVPQITILPEGFDSQAILAGAATQMGFDLLEDIHLAVKTHSPQKIEQEDLPAGRQVSKIDEEDIVMTEKEQTENNDFGFVINGDIEDKEEILKTSGPIHTSDNFVAYEPEETEPVVHSPKTKNNFAPFFGVFDSIKETISSLHIPLRLPTFSGKQKPIIIGGLAVASIIGIIIGYMLLIHATVTISVKAKVVEENAKITFSTTSPTDTSKNIIFVETKSVTRDGTLSKPTTGTKEVGEKAKGEVTIYNSSLVDDRDFPKGTVITSPNGLDFLLDSDVKVASASGDASSITSSTAKVNVSAKDIGKEYNLPSGTKFSIGNISQSLTIAKNNSAFSGGSKKEVTVVAKKDQDSLMEDLPKSMQEDVKNELLKSISGDFELIPGFFNTTLTKKEFDKNINDEAKAVTLKATISFDGLVYKKSEITDVLKNAIGSKDASLELSDQSVSYETKKIEKQKNGDIVADVIIKGAFIPKIDKSSVLDSIKGKSFSFTKNLIQKIPQVESVSISLSPSLPFLPQQLPRIVKNIQVIININE